MSVVESVQPETVPRPRPFHRFPKVNSILSSTCPTTYTSVWQFFKTIDDRCPKGKELPPDYTPDFKAIARKVPTYRAPGVLFYGLGLDFQDLLDYADRHLVIDSSISDPVERYSCARTDGLEHLRELCNFEDFDIGLPISPDYQIVLVFWDNYTIDELELETEQEEDVVRILRENFSVFSTQEPRWFFDRGDEKNGA